MSVQTIEQATTELDEAFTVPCDIGRRMDRTAEGRSKPCNNPAEYTATIHDCDNACGVPVLFCFSHLEEVLNQKADGLFIAKCRQCNRWFVDISEIVWNIRPLGGSS